MTGSNSEFSDLTNNFADSLSAYGVDVSREKSIVMLITSRYGKTVYRYRKCPASSILL